MIGIGRKVGVNINKNNENIYISSFQASKIYSHNFRDEYIKHNQIGSLTLSLELLKLKKEGFNIYTSKLHDKKISKDIINVDFKFKVDSSKSIYKKVKKKIKSIISSLREQKRLDIDKYNESIENEDNKDVNYLMGMIKYRHELKHKDWNEVSQEELRHM